jgi:hypothetical protein
MRQRLGVRRRSQEVLCVVVVLAVLLLMQAYRRPVDGQQPRILAISIFALESPESTVPYHVKLWLHSCRVNRWFLDCLLLVVTLSPSDKRTSASQVMACPTNDDDDDKAIRIRVLSHEFFRRDLMENKFGFRVKLKYGRKFIDFKPMYGALAYELGYLRNNDTTTHWAWTDVDGVIGAKLHEVTRMPSNLTTITFYGKDMWVEPTLAGQITAFANTEEGRNVWRKVPAEKLVPIIEFEGSTVFDEIGMAELLKTDKSWARANLHEWQASDHFAITHGRAETYRVHANGSITNPLTGQDYVFLHFSWLKKKEVAGSFFLSSDLCAMDVQSGYDMVIDGKKSRIVTSTF